MLKRLIEGLDTSKPYPYFELEMVNDAGEVVWLHEQRTDDCSAINFCPAIPGYYKPRFIWCGKQLGEKPGVVLGAGESLTLILSDPPMSVSFR